MPLNFDEMIVRGRQAAFQWLDRLIAPWRRAGSQWNPFSELTAGPALGDMRRFLQLEDYWGAAATLRHHLTSQLPGRFFAGVFDDALVARIGADDRQQIVASADLICQGRFDFLGYHELTFGDPLDWHLDPVARRRVPLVHWSRIDPYDVTVCGDSRIIWQLNRHQWLIQLGEAYRLTGNVRYAECFDETIRDWIRVNPAGMGINWASSLEVAHRLIAWCWALALFWHTKVITADFLILMLDEIRLHAEHVERYRSSERAPGSPRTVEGLALLYAGLLFPEFRLADRWRQAGLGIMEQRILTQVSSDGVYYEQSTAHQRRAIEAYLHFLILAERHAQPISQDIRPRVEAMVTTQLKLQRPDGLMMRIGEMDGEWLLPFVSRNRDDWRGIYAVAAALFLNAHAAWAAGGETPELLWLLGSAGLQRYGSLSPEPPEDAPSQECARGGYVQMRSGWERQSHQLVLDIGSARGGATGGAQADLLSIQCSVFGEPMVVDPDISGPAGHREWQHFVKNTGTHSTILVDGVSPGGNAPHRLPSVRRGPRAVLRQWSSNERFDLVDAEHDGYRTLAQPVIHRRRVLFIKRAYWVLIDDLDGVGRHHVDLLFQLAALPAQLDASLWAKIWTPHGPGLAIKPFASMSLQGQIRESVNETGADRQGRRQPAPTLAYSGEAEVPVRLVTLLFPLRDRDAAVPPVVPFLDEDGRLSGLTIGDPPSTILYSDHSVSVEAA